MGKESQKGLDPLISEVRVYRVPEKSRDVPDSSLRAQGKQTFEGGY